MSKDANKPQLTDAFSAILTDIRDIVDSLLRLNMDGVANLPVGAKRWSDSNSRFEEYDGSSWSELVPHASTTIRGPVILSNNTNSTSQSYAATSNALRNLRVELQGLITSLDGDALKRNGSASMTGDLDAGNNDINNVGIIRAGSSQQVRAGFWGGQGQLWSNAGGLHIGSDDNGEDIILYCRNGGVTRAVCKFMANGDVEFYGNATFNHGTISL